MIVPCILLLIQIVILISSKKFSIFHFKLNDEYLPYKSQNESILNRDDRGVHDGHDGRGVRDRSTYPICDD